MHFNSKTKLSSSEVESDIKKNLLVPNLKVLNFPIQITASDVENCYV
jgi:hypothetical protein